MALSWTEIHRRLNAASGNGEIPSLFTGKETDAELRDFAMLAIRNCASLHNHPHCEIHPLTGLSYSAVNVLLDRMPRKDLLELLYAERNCHAHQANHRPA